MDKISGFVLSSLSNLDISRCRSQGKWRVDSERVAYRLDSIARGPHRSHGFTPLFPLLSFPDVPPSSTAPTTSFHPLRFPTRRTDHPRPVSNSKQLRTHQEGLRRLKSTRLKPTKFAYLRLRSQVKWRLQEISRRKRTPSDLPSPFLPPSPSSSIPLSCPPFGPSEDRYLLDHGSCSQTVQGD